VGRRTLAEGCERVGVGVEVVVGRLAALATTPAAPCTNWDDRPVVSLLANLAQRHEADRVELTELHELLEDATRGPGSVPDALAKLGDALHGLERALQSHIADTAARLFPHIVGLEQGARAQHLAKPAAARLIHRLRSDHESVRALLESVRKETAGYVPPDGASNEVRELYARLAVWERRAHAHAHLENDVLVSRLLSLDPSIERDARPITIPTHERELLTATGRQRELTVFCPSRRESVGLEWCRNCAFARRVTEAGVECTPVGSPMERSASPLRIGEEIAVGEAMGGRYVSVGPQVPAGVVIDALEADRAYAAVIVDDTDHLVGTVRRDGVQTAQEDLVASALGRDTPYIDESASLANAIACMVKTHTRFLPVVGRQGRVVGLLADTDALRWVAAYHAIRRP
jgi:iron-sulfur cluster repair protein YtfE (RIC family)/CBS domain-containing protein